MENSNQNIVQNKWFKWVLIAVLLFSNIISYQATSRFFDKNDNMKSSEVTVDETLINPSSRIINWAQEILRFFRNPQ